MISLMPGHRNSEQLSQILFQEKKKRLSFFSLVDMYYKNLLNFYYTLNFIKKIVEICFSLVI